MTPEAVGSKPSIHLMFIDVSYNMNLINISLEDTTSSFPIFVNLMDIIESNSKLTPVSIIDTIKNEYSLTLLNSTLSTINFADIIITHFNNLQIDTVEVEIPTSFYAVSGDKTFDNYHDYALHRLDLELNRRQKRRPDLTKDQIFELMNGLDSDSIAYCLEEIENAPAPDTSNIFKHKGQEIDVTKLSRDEIFHYLVTIDETKELMNLEHVRTMFHVSTPNEMLHYPEPFTASPSFIHEDLHFLHILHYQFWLWFFFIFLIVFFFISFLCTVRWCQIRNKPRRETRGVSRSKCGDLITAIVPVTWAISIIVGESTDAADTFDGFATNEVMVGIRAYQWGWEYFYPKDINLQYNVAPTYSAFIGNSLKYSPSSDLTLKSNALWKQYQKKDLDQVVTPAHLLILPVDNHKMFSLLNFNDIGATTSNKSTAFKKIRANSKIFNTNLVSTPTPFTNRYIMINKLLANETKFLNSTNYGLRRQHNLTANAALNANNLNFLDRQGFNKFLDHSCKYNADKAGTTFFNTNPHTLNKKVLSTLNTGATLNTQVLNSPLIQQTASNTVVDKLNLNQLESDANSDWASIDNLFFTGSSHNNIDALSPVLGKDLENKTASSLPESELLNNPVNYDIQVLNSNLWGNNNSLDLLVDKENELHTETSVSNLSTSTLSNNPLNYETIFNVTRTISNYELKVNSEDKSAIPAEQSIRYQLGTSPQLLKHSNLNQSASWNTSQSNLELNSKLAAGTQLEDSFFDNELGHVDKQMLSKMLTNRFYLSTSTAPVVSTNPRASVTNYDNPNFTLNELVSNSPRLLTNWDVNSSTPLIEISESKSGEVINILQGKREGSFEAASTAYWHQFWANSNSDLRLESVLKSNKLESLFYLPDFTTYYDYDFRNEQALELLEEVFWETSYSGYSHLDYLDINDSLLVSGSGDIEKNAYVGFYRLDKSGNVYNLFAPSQSLFKTILSPTLEDISSLGRYYSNQVQSDDFFLPSNLLSTQNFILFTLGDSDVTIEDSYLEFKNYATIFNTNNYSTKPLINDLSSVYSTSHILNSFRSSYEDFTWYGEENLGNLSSLLRSKNDLLLPNQLRFTTHPSLRLPAKNSITTFNALQKVFRTRFDEGRMNTKSSHFGNMAIKQPFVNAGRFSYEGMLGKNKESFYNTVYFPVHTMKTINLYSSLMESSKMAFYDFPFLLSEKAEAPMYLWFDWFSKWRWIDVQPVITGKYSTLGVPAVRKFFDYNVDQNSNISDSDLYTTRISRARHNYLPNWLYTPYLYSKSQFWNKVYNDTNILYSGHSYRNLKDTRLVFEKGYWIWQDLFLEKNLSDHFTPSISGDSIHNKSTWRPLTGIQSYYYSNALLVDLLTKREYVYRTYFEKNHRIISLPKSFTTHPHHPLIKELKASFQFIDPITYGSSYSRETYYNSLSYFKFLLLKNWLTDINIFQKSSQLSETYLPVNTKFVNNYFFYYFFGSKSQTKIGRNLDCYKNQYRPLKKGITTMLRLHGTGAVAMPIEMRLRILASSRDVIHSWSVPSAGVKIDCIPGYTSHRIMTFMTPGIYWGQCQEICGRYHHWMPIICYFMKRDLFFLWCTHFIFKESPRECNNSSARQFNDYIRFASYDKSSWLSEISMK